MLHYIVDESLEGRIALYNAVQFGDITILPKQQIGKGGNGVVWKITWNNRAVALKQQTRGAEDKLFIREVIYLRQEFQ